MIKMSNCTKELSCKPPPPIIQLTNEFDKHPSTKSSKTEPERAAQGGGGVIPEGVQEPWICGTEKHGYGHGGGGLAMDLGILEIFSSLDCMILWFCHSDILVNDSTMGLGG